ncbi:MAG: hypothetical protein ACYC6F_01970 [Longimicrobiales bacterium]
MLSDRVFRSFLDQPWLPVGLPAFVSVSLLAWLAFGAHLVGVARVGAELLDDLNGLGAAVLPEGYLDQRRGWGELTVGERFRGQQVRSVEDRDVLEGSPDGQLRIEPGDPGFSLYRGDHRVYGPNVSGVGPHGVRGTGALAVWFPREQWRVGVRLVRGGGGNATLTFYSRRGRRLDRVTLKNVESRVYAFERGGRRRDIAGFTLENDDPGNGLGLAEVRFDAIEPILAVGSPRRAVVFRMPVAAAEGSGADAGTFGGRLAAALEWYSPGLTALAVDEVAPPHREAAWALASSRDAGVFVTGQARRDAAGFHARAALYAPGSLGEAVAVADATGPDELAATEQLARRLSVAMAVRSGRVVEAAAFMEMVEPARVRGVLTARDALRAGRLGEAAATLDALPPSATDFMSVLYTRSQIAYLERRPEEAQALAQRALEAAVTPDSRARAAAWFALLSGDAAEAARGFRALAGNEADADAWFGLVESLASAPELPGGDREGVLEALRAGLGASGDHVGLVAHLVRFSLADRHPAYIDFWTAKTRRRDPERRTRIGLELDLLVAAFRDDERAYRTLTADPRLQEPGYRLALARSLAFWAERPDLARDLLSSAPANPTDAEHRAFLALLDRAEGRVVDVDAIYSCLPVRTDGVGPAPRRGVEPPGCPDPIRAAVAFETEGDLAAAWRALAGKRGPDPQALPWLAMRHLHLAALAELEGDGAQAIRHYERFRRLWAPAGEPAQELLAYARERVAWLQPGS